jgi:hypothetical protein
MNKEASMFPVAHYLATNIGSRPAGSPSEYDAALYLSELFRKKGLDVEVQPFHFLNWTPIGQPTFKVLEPEEVEIPVAPMAFTLPTSASGVEGNIKKIGFTLLQFGNIKRQKYVLADDNGVEVGYFLKGGNDKASTFPSGAPLIQMPGVIMGAADAEAKVEAWLTQGRKIRARLINPCVQGMSTSQNVIARTGNGAPRMVICAHYDGVYNSPSAIDNGSGVQILANVADHLIADSRAGKKIPPLAFICFGCEELKFNGSNHYVKYLQEHDALASIRYVVNFDMVGHGTDITLSTGRGMDSFTAPLVEKYAPRFKSKLVPGEAKPSSDHWAFHEANIASVQFTGLPYPFYHQDADTMDRFEPIIMEETEKFAMALLYSLFEDLKS